MAQAKKTTSKQAVKLAQTQNCVQFYTQNEQFIEEDDVENLCDYNEGTVNLIYHGTDRPVAIAFYDGEYTNWSYCS